MPTTLRFPIKSVVLLLFIILLCDTPEQSSAATGDFFRFQRFSAGKLQHSLGLSRTTKYAEEPSSASKSGKLEPCVSRNWSASPVGPLSSSSLTSMTNPNAKALRGVRKLLFGTLSCAPKDLSLTQGPVSSTSGIPTFNVQIVNLCGACAMADIHVACGNWASATPVDPFVFTRLGYNDCLVNNGQPLSSQGSVSFQYSNSAMYPMSIATATNECTR